MNCRELIEARSHSEQNPRILVRDYIEQRYQHAQNNHNIIANLVNVFVNFGEIEKLGIHPQAPNTLDELPIGIWAYPAELILAESTHKWLYAGMNPWVNVFELQGNVINLNTISRGRQEQLIDQASDIIASSQVPLYRDDKYWLNNELVFNTVEDWWSLLIHMAFKFKQHLGIKNGQLAANKLHRLLGIDAVVDPGSYLITDDIKGQAIIFRSSAITANYRLPNIYNHPYTWSQPSELDMTIGDMIGRIVIYLRQRELSAESAQLARAFGDVEHFLQQKLQTNKLSDTETPAQWFGAVSKHVRSLLSVNELSAQDARTFWMVFKQALTSARNLYS